MLGHCNVLVCVLASGDVEELFLDLDGLERWIKQRLTKEGKPQLKWATLGHERKSANMLGRIQVWHLSPSFFRLLYFAMRAGFVALFFSFLPSQA